MKSSYKFPLEHYPAKKGPCPACGHNQVYRHFENQPREYGICDRINECGHKHIPTQTQELAALATPARPEQTTVFPPLEHCRHVLAGQQSAFHDFVTRHLQLPPEHLTCWNCGSIEDDTAFIYQNVQHQYVNIVRIQYGANGKRNKTKTPHSLTARQGERYSMCLFGEHLLRKEPKICLVESEKTAILASFFYPQFDWLATGGANKLTDEKIHVLFNREIYYVGDADKAGKNNSTLKKLRAYELNFKIVELYPDRTDGYDLADAIIGGQRPEITPSMPQSEALEKEAPKPPKRMSGSKLSIFEQVESYLNSLYEIRYNEVSNEIEYRENKEGKPSPFAPLNEANIYRLLKHNHIKISQADISALLRSEFVTPYNPLADYFTSLGSWNKDTEPDYIQQLSTYVPVQDPERFGRQFKKMFVRTIACALTKVYNKQAFILMHSKQNSGKSTFCRWLCPPTLENYIAENISTDKDSLIALSENFLINMDELATLNKAEINSLKTMFSRDVIKVRRPFERKACTSLRRASFIGSTNKKEILTDETGSVRWLCFELTGRINWNYKQDISIDDIWRQAYALFKEGFKYELTAEEIRENEQANQEYQVMTPEMELISKHYQPGTKEDHQAFYTATDFMQNLSEKCHSLRVNPINIGKALKFLQFTQSSERRTGILYPIKGYFIKFI